MKQLPITNQSLMIAIIIVAIVLIGAVAAMTFMQPKEQPAPTATETNGTKLAFYNNGTTWLHLNIVLENVTLQNGTTQNFYVQMFLKPNNGTGIIDLSNITGYGNQKIPAGTSITVLAWKGLFMPAGSTPAVGSASDLSLNMQGWSGAAQPGTDDPIYNVVFPQLNITQLPTISGNQITGDTVIISTNPNEVQFVPQISENQNHVFEQEVVTIDQNGKVTIIIVQAPTLCALVADIT